MENHVVRQLDELGRIVIPVETRNALGWAESDHISITYNEDGVFLRKESKSKECAICGAEKDLKPLYICKKCLKDELSD